MRGKARVARRVWRLGVVITCALGLATGCDTNVESAPAVVDPIEAAPAPIVSPNPDPTLTATPTPGGHEDPPEVIAPPSASGAFPIVINGEELDSTAKAVGADQIFPNYLPLVAVADALGATDFGGVAGLGAIAVAGGGFNLRTPTGRNIAGNIGSPDFTAGTTTMTLSEPALAIDGLVYVPLSFFREVFGIPNVFFEGGQVELGDFPDLE